VAENTLLLKIMGNSKNAQQAVKALDKEVGGLSKSGSLMTGAFAAAGAALLIAFGKKSVAAYQDSQLQLLKLQNTIANMPKLAGSSTAAFEEQAAAIQKVTAADGDAIIAGQAMLGTFSTTEDQILGLTPLVVDYARKFGVDLVDANKAVGKAMDGQIGALKKQGVSIDAAMFATDRYGAIVSALRNQVGGFAESEAASGVAASERLGVAFEDLQENIGEMLAPTVVSVTNKMTDMVNAINDMSPEAKKAAANTTLWAGGLLAVFAGGAKLIGWGKTWQTAVGPAVSSAFAKASGAATGLNASISTLPGVASIAASGMLSALGPVAPAIANLFPSEATGAEAAHGLVWSQTRSIEDMTAAVDHGVVSWKQIEDEVNKTDTAFLSGAARAEILAAATAGMASSASGAAGAIANETSEVDELQRAMDGSMVTMDDYSGKQRSLTEQGWDKEKADIAVRKAQDDYSEAVKKSGVKSDEAKLAFIRLKEAELAAKDATYDYVEARAVFNAGTPWMVTQAGKQAAAVKAIGTAAGQAAQKLSALAGFNVTNPGAKYGGVQIPQHAKGAFNPGIPEHDIWGEDGPEVKIPLSEKYSSEAASLFAKTASILGKRVAGMSSGGVVVQMGDNYGSRSDAAFIEQAAARGVHMALATAGYPGGF